MVGCTDARIQHRVYWLEPDLNDEVENCGSNPRSRDLDLCCVEIKWCYFHDFQERFPMIYFLDEDFIVFLVWCVLSQEHVYKLVISMCFEDLQSFVLMSDRRLINV